MTKTLTEELESWLLKYSDEIALSFSDKNYSYKDLDLASKKIKDFLLSKKNSEPYIGVFATKNFFTYASILAIIRAGKAYVPLNPSFPIEKNLEIIKESGIKTLFINNTDRKIFKEHPDTDTVSPELITEEITDAGVTANVSSAAYILFTSGTTGKPKGVLITHKNLLSYLENIQKLVKIEKGDRCSQTFGLTFDLSVHDIFFTWKNGACLCTPEENELLSPASYIKNKKLTHWFSVPSTGILMDKLRQLKENNFPDLKNVLFCGEALRTDLARKFMKAAPNAVCYNLYGPTEATIAIFAYKIEEPIKEKNGIVSIGKIFACNRSFITKERIDYFNGELCLNGAQVIQNYFNNSEADKACFYEDHKEVNWYKTGDTIEIDEENNFYFLGRKDTQIKLNGFRIELEEIESVLLKESGNSNTIVFVNEKSASPFLVAALEGEKTTENTQLLDKCRQKLAPYMIPQQIVYLHTFPLNVNGKVDRKAIIQTITNK
ncbi:MAG: AMP-binding protein [Bacteroidia bacterium]|nr:AMP-binding protein [Bacteroidia bacterium]